jgi:hypothetical protein
MTLDEAIKHCEEVADKKNKEACNLYDAKNYEESRDCIWCSEEHRQLAEWLKELKQLREQTSWIPVSERLPEDRTYVLTTIKVPNRQAHARSGWYEGGFFHNDNGDTWKKTDMEVRAWMPLPEPYEPQESEG